MIVQNLNAVRAKKPKRLPIVLTVEEVRLIMNQLTGAPVAHGQYALRRRIAPGGMLAAQSPGY